MKIFYILGHQNYVKHPTFRYGWNIYLVNIITTSICLQMLLKTPFDLANSEK